MHRDQGLLRHIAIPFALFVVVGSLALVGWLVERDRRESIERFRTLAETNADFIPRLRLPATPKLADYFSEILEMTVAFRTDDALVTPTAATLALDDAELARLRESGTVVRIADGQEAILAPVEPGVAAIFVRRAPGFLGSLLRWTTLLPLFVFWLLSLLLAVIVSRALVRPIQTLASNVSAMESTDPLPRPLPGAERDDEIGHLARTLTETHDHLRDERRRREESEKLAMLGKMATGLAHEIRNPVAAVRMHAQLLRRSGVEPDTAKLIEGEAETIGNLVTQWMFLARPEPPETREQDLREIAARCVRALGAAADHAQVRIETESGAPLVCKCDGERIGQAVRNILLNGIQAMPDGGTLIVSGAAADGKVAIRVRDEGAGFSGDALEKFSELFFSTREGGMGLGLSVASEIAKAHGGTVTVENHSSGGARVTLELPSAS